MDRLQALQYLLKIADTLSFSRAARTFGVPASSVSRRIADLEASLGVELVHRTTRTVRLTELGAQYVDQVRAGLAQLADADETAAGRVSSPSGTLRISAMPGYGQLLLMPVLQAFAERYPDIALDVHLSDTLVDLGRDQVDIAVRGGPQPGGRVIARKLDDNRFLLAASPVYLDRMGTPRAPQDLARHRTLMYRGPNTIVPWQTQDDAGWHEIPLRPAFVSNDGVALVNMACRHQGLVLLAEWGLRDFLRRGDLVHVTLDRPVGVGRGAEMAIHLVMLPTRYRVPKVRLAVDFLLRHLGATAVRLP